MVKRKKRKRRAEEVTYRATEPEQAVLSKQIERLNAKPPAPRMKIVGDGNGTTISLDHPNETVAEGILKEALGTANADFANGLLSQLYRSQDGKISEGELNFMLAVIAGITPNDQLEAMLGAQMAAVHMAIMKFSRNLDGAKYLEHRDSAERAFTKLARTFTDQMETLKRYRTGGQQTVTVQHVSVNEGGQAIVGNVTQDVRESVPQKRADEPLALTDSRQQPMPTIEERRRERQSVPACRKQKDDRQSSS